MTPSRSLTDRVRDYQPTKTALLWSCAASVALALVVGFNWGGWVTGTTATSMAEDASAQASAQLAATVCVDQFMNAPDATVRLASLKQEDAWKHESFVSKGGWATLPGMQEPVRDAAELCATRLIQLEQPAKAASQ